MCGIFGAVSTDAGRFTTVSARAAIDAMEHRGPDDSGIWLGQNCTLGHRRLSIIDLSSAAKQPMASHDAGLQVTFNGEIYNFEKLRGELEALGHAFRTRSDTEVILHAYKQWGEECVTRLRGMFAFGIWDEQRRRLFLARDRVGKKPLFYGSFGGLFVFGSELQSILGHPDVPREPNLEALDHYLAFGYVPSPLSAFKNIHKLPPAHWMTVDLARGELRVHQEKYWRLDYSNKLQVSDAEAGEMLRETLMEAVRLRMISDVPLGAFLSGGIDSSIIVGLMAKMSGTPVKTFSIGFTQAGFDETSYAREVARRWGTEHTEFVVQPEAQSVLPMLVRNFGEPFADSSAIPTYYVSKTTREHVTVALTGDGGDENFGGYKRYSAYQLALATSRMPGSRAAARLAAQMVPSSFQSPHKLHSAKRLLQFLGHDPQTAYQETIMLLSDAWRDKLLSPEFRKQVPSNAPSRYLQALTGSLNGVSTKEWPLAIDTISYLPEDILVKVDIASMAASLECRAPFLDQEVMELAAKLPFRMKIRGGKLKYLLKKEFADLLPRAVRTRTKMGFGVPIGEWFRGPLRPLVEDALSPKTVASRGILDAAAVQELLQEHQLRRADHSHRIWALLMLEMWFREVVESRVSEDLRDGGSRIPAIR